MSWDSFVWFALAASAFWICGAAVSLKSKRGLPAAVLSGSGSVIFLAFIVGVWIGLGRPPLRTMGETRLWFSLFLSLVGLGVYLRWRYRWVLPFSCLMSVVFVCINIFKPEIHTEELMPALRSPWFIPHVIVYMFAYAVLGVATILALRLLWMSRRQSESERRMLESECQPQSSECRSLSLSKRLSWPRILCPGHFDKLSDRTIRQARRPKSDPHRPADDLRLCDTLVRIGWGFLTMGIVMGALWAKQAWGDYWTWDPKETWAAATWLSYLLYLHLRQGHFSFAPSSRPVSADESASHSLRLSLVLLVFSFLLLQMCWWGVNYLPSAKGFSLHTY